MSDLIEEAKRQQKDPYNVDKCKEMMNKLIAEVENLRGKYKEAEEHLLVYTQGQDRRILREIESLTTERDELQSLIDKESFTGDCHLTAKIKIEKLEAERDDFQCSAESSSQIVLELEAENAEIKKAREHTQTANVYINHKFHRAENSWHECQDKLADSEKVRKELIFAISKLNGNVSFSDGMRQVLEIKKLII